jgi:hypothetical protein
MEFNHGGNAKTILEWTLMLDGESGGLEVDFFFFERHCSKQQLLNRYTTAKHVAVSFLKTIK